RSILLTYYISRHCPLDSAIVGATGADRPKSRQVRTRANEPLNLWPPPKFERHQPYLSPVRQKKPVGTPAQSTRHPLSPATLGHRQFAPTGVIHPTYWPCVRVELGLAIHHATQFPSLRIARSEGS